VGKRVRELHAFENQWGEVLVKDIAGAPSPGKALVYKVHRARFYELFWLRMPESNAPRPMLTIDPALPKPGVIGDLPKPLIFGGVLFNEETVRSDFLFGSSSVAGMTRDLKNERFRVRLPKGYSPSVPAGVLVWIDGDRVLGLREELFEALDAFNIVGVTPENAGNDRPLSDRAQLAFDALESVRSRVLIDQRRVYIGGISGGGRVASMLALAFPDTFSACLSVVGVNSCYNVRLPDGKQVQRSSGIPNSRVLGLLEGYKIAAITGSEDFNRPEILARAESFKKIKVNCKVFDCAGMGHQMPKSKDVKDAIDWFDLLARQTATESQKNLGREWKAALAKMSAGQELSAVQRSELFAGVRGRLSCPEMWDGFRRAYPSAFPAPPAQTK
jgi:predicted esterase